MSAQLYYSIPNTNQRTPSTMAYSDNPALLAGPRRRSPPQQGFGPGGINMYHQQQIQSALYQQQQIEFAQQQAQLEMHLQLEQMRLQNLALQEQIMIGQAHAHQAHAQAHAQAQAEQQQLHNTYYSTNKSSAPARITFTQGQGGILAERALARRQQAEADALYAQCYPNLQEEDDVLRELAHAPPFSSVSSERSSSNLTPPAVVVSKPDEAFPLLASANALMGKAYPNLTNQQASPDSQTASSATTSSQGSVSPSSSIDNPQIKDLPAVPTKKKFSEVVKSSSAPKPASTPPTNPTAGQPPKLNPFSSVFVPGSNSSSESEAPVSKSPPTQKIVSFTEPAPESASSPGVYRPPRAKSPPSAKANRVSSNTTPLAPTIQSVPGGMPTRQPRGPAAEAELTNQNFATRIRKRAIGAIKTLGTRPPTSPTPVMSNSASNYHYYQQQQMLEALMMQQHQQQALAAAGYVDSDLGFHSAVHSSGGIAHLMATARAREERFGY